jgi:hypothetical protein
VQAERPVAEVDAHPRLADQRLREPADAPLCAQARDRLGDQLGREGADRGRGVAEVEGGLGVARERAPRERVDHVAPAAHRCRQRARVDQLRMARRDRHPGRGLEHERLGLLVRIRPPAAEGDVAQPLQSALRVAFDAHAVGDLDQRGGARGAGPQLGREQLAQPGQAGALAGAERERLGVAQEPDDDVAAAELERELRRAQQPGSAARGEVAELGGAGERGDRDGQRAAPLGRGRRPLQLARGRLVRPDDRRRAMPDAAVELDDRRERGVGGVALGDARGLADRGAHERVPEAQLVALDRDELGGDRRLQRTNSVFVGGQQ